MKKIKLIALGLIVVCCFGTMVACGEKSTTSSDSGNSTSTSTEETVYTQDVKIINNTGVEINEIYISAANKSDWEEDVLKEDTLATGGDVKITFSEAEKAQYWDLMVTDSEGTAIIWEKIDLFSISEITLNYDESTETATASYK